MRLAKAQLWHRTIRQSVATLLIGVVSVVCASAQQNVDDANIVDVGKDGIRTHVESETLVQDTLVEKDGALVRHIFALHIGEQSGRSPQTAAMYAAVLPGLGQIYNHKYWKLPLLYGGAGALGYCIHFNNKYYKKYSSAYRDFLLKDPNNKSYMEFVNKAHLSEEDVMTTYSSWFTATLKKKKDYYRRYRDLSIFGMIGLYAIQIVDASVDAHFFNFDVSDDISVSWAPTFEPGADKNIGASLAITF